MKRTILAGAALLALAACGDGFTGPMIPTPESLGLPTPAVIPNPGALASPELCAYAAEMETAAAAWEAHINRWIFVLGGEPVSLGEYLAASEEAQRALAARNLACGVPA